MGRLRAGLGLAVAGQVLVQRAAAGDVERLRAAADAEHRHPALGRRARERELEGVERGLGRPELHVALAGAVGVGVQVGAAREADAVEPGDQRLEVRDAAAGARPGRRPHARSPADRSCRAPSRGGRLALTAQRREPAGAELRRGDADHGPHGSQLSANLRGSNMAERTRLRIGSPRGRSILTGRVEPIHLHHVQAVPDAPAGQAGAEGHLAQLHAGRQDRRAGPQRLGQVDPAADHGRARTPSTAARRSSRPAPPSGCSSRSPTSTSPRTCAATSRRASRRSARCSTASTSWPPTTRTRPPTSSAACRSRSTPPTPGTSTRSSTRRWTRCACRPATPT